MTPVRVFFQTLMRPFQTTVTGAASQAGNLAQRRQTIEEIQQDNAFLQAEVNRLLVDNIRLKELERENQRLRELLNYTQNNPSFDYTTTSVVGRVIGADPTNLLYTIFVDVGAKDGIAKDMPVVTHRGLVGRVIQVGPNSAQVLLIIDPASSVNALIQNSRVHGIVKGELGGTLTMERISQGEAVVPGDLVLTSGLGGAFPDKLVIGQITEVFQRDLDLFQTARVRSTVDFGNLETVLVLTAFQPVDFEKELLNTQEAGD
jgi:rod shape-determining protein MreC